MGGEQFNGNIIIQMCLQIDFKEQPFLFFYPKIQKEGNLLPSPLSPSYTSSSSFWATKKGYNKKGWSGLEQWLKGVIPLLTMSTSHNNFSLVLTYDGTQRSHSFTSWSRVIVPNCITAGDLHVRILQLMMCLHNHRWTEFGTCHEIYKKRRTWELSLRVQLCPPAELKVHRSKK